MVKAMSLRSYEQDYFFNSHDDDTLELFPNATLTG